MRTASVGLLAASLAIAGVLGLGQAAAAAPTVTHPGAISGIVLENERGDTALGQHQAVRITGDWAVPDGAKGGDTFGMTLPQEFTQDSAAAFPITDPASGIVLAECAVTAGPGPDVVCTLTDAVDDIEDVSGTFWLYARATQVTSSETVEFDLGGTVEVVDLPGAGGIVPTPTAEETEPYKYGGATSEPGRLRWVVGIPSGQVAGGGFTVTDVLEAGAVDHRYTGEIRLARRAVENGALVGEWTDVDPSRYDVVLAPDGRSFTLTASGLPTEGFAYELSYDTQVDGAVAAGDIVGNRATVQGIEVASSYTFQNSGGGDGSGTARTGFSVTKALTGPAAAAADAADAVYTIRYTVEGSDDPAAELSFRVGEVALSRLAPLGSTFVIEEIELPAVDGVAWGEWVLSGEGVTATSDGRYAVTPRSAAAVELTLTNTANPVTVVPPRPMEPPKTVAPPKPVAPVPAPALALTGGDGGAGLLPIALALIAAGSVLTGASALRRRALRN